MKRLVWSTDIHLNFVDPPVLDEYFERLVDAAPDAVLISGDIAESGSLLGYLKLLSDHLDCRIYFVLGNHDFYYGSIEQVRDEVRQLCRDHPKLVYLTDGPVVEISARVGLVGHDGWADGRIGDYERSMVMMNDYRLIKQFVGLGKEQRWSLMKALGDQAATAVRQVLSQAMARYERVIFVTHIPPLREACWYNGRVSDDEWAPHFTCKAVGDVMLEIARQYPDCQLTALCGHTHSSGEAHPLARVTIITGGAEYGFPSVNQVFQVPDGEMKEEGTT